MEISNSVYRNIEGYEAYTLLRRLIPPKLKRLIPPNNEFETGSPSSTTLKGVDLHAALYNTLKRVIKKHPLIKIIPRMDITHRGHENVGIIHPNNPDLFSLILTIINERQIRLESPRIFNKNSKRTNRFMKTTFRTEVKYSNPERLATVINKIVSLPLTVCEIAYMVTFKDKYNRLESYRISNSDNTNTVKLAAANFVYNRDNSRYGVPADTVDLYNLVGYFINSTSRSHVPLLSNCTVDAWKYTKEQISQAHDVVGLLHDKSHSVVLHHPVMVNSTGQRVPEPHTLAIFQERNEAIFYKGDPITLPQEVHSSLAMLAMLQNTESCDQINVNGIKYRDYEIPDIAVLRAGVFITLETAEFIKCNWGRVHAIEI